MTKIIFLNGCGSSGKTSIARAIQTLSTEPWLRFSVDMFIDMMPDQYIAFGNRAGDGYFEFVPGSNDRGPTMQVKVHPKGEQVFALMPSIANLLASKGNNLIIDEILLDDEGLNVYLEELKSHTVYFIGVFCALSAMQEREILRRDRAIGLSNDQIDRVHKGLKNYDLTVDTTSNSPFDAARQILSFLDTSPLPQGFESMRK